MRDLGGGVKWGAPCNGRERTWVGAWFTQLCEFIIFHLPGPQCSHLQTGESGLRKDGKSQAWL